MKKQLLALTLTLMSFGMFSQSTIWEPHDINTDTAWGVRYMSVVDSSTMWATTFNGWHTTAISNRFTRTEDGNTFIPGTFMADADTNYYTPSSITAVNDSVAFVTCFFTSGAGRPGIVKKTKDRGLTWKVCIDTTTMFQTANNFPNWSYFWDEANGITMGDPNGGYFEIWKTADSGNTWARVPQANIQAQTSGAYGVTDVYTTWGTNHIWFGTIHASNANNHVYRSNNRGLTWQSSQIPGLQGGVNGLTFRDSLNGMAFGYTATSGGKFMLKKTNDGGITWSTVKLGNFVGTNDVCAIPGRGAYMSVGIDSASTQYLTSVTYDDGKTWTVLESGLTAPFRMLKVAMLDSAHGWAGTFSDNTMPLGLNGADRYMGPVIPASCPINVTGGNNVCSGASLVLTANGTAGATYTWTPGAVNTNTISITASTSQVYSVTNSYNGCTNTATYSLTVKPTPTVTAVAASDTICALNSTVLTATGGTTYNWSPATGLSSTTSATVTGTYNTAGTYTYNATGTTNGCSSVASVTVEVLACVGVKENTNNNIAAIFPNPGKGMVNLTLGNAGVSNKIVVMDMIGNQVFNTSVPAGASKLNIDLTAMPKGMYLITVSNSTGSSTSKMIIE